MGGAVMDLTSKSELDNLRQSGAPVVLHFWASWCDASKQMDQVFSHLATDFPRAHFFRVEAEEHPEISEAYSVAAVPYFVFFKDGKAVDTLEGADPSSLANKVGKVAGSSTSAEPAAPASLGLAAGPTILETVKENAKATAQDRAQPVSTTTDALKTRLEKLTNSHPVMLFMKGTPEEPRCGFSRKVVDILKEEKVDFGSFDILSDNEVREGLKKFSNWPTFPQLYCKGELLGGADITIAMHESGELKEAFIEQGIATTVGSNDEASKVGGMISLEDRLKALINSEKVMLFMKGSPDEPKCGFSSKVVKALRAENVSFGSFDILSDEEVRQGIKNFSNWPTFPQLYYKGELIGGCDIIMELSESGDLKATLSE
uniref:Monothiol glutaredoxin-S17 n=1 Tax=Noccaea caerulescens TaxID=107243 RepID=A0A1J3CRA9_NOCCA